MTRCNGRGTEKCWNCGGLGCAWCGYNGNLGCVTCGYWHEPKSIYQKILRQIEKDTR